MNEKQLDMIEFPCPVCNSSRYKILYPDTLQGRIPSFDYDFSRHKNRTFRMVKCLQCTHVYASPRPASIWHYYTEDKVDPIYIGMEMHRQRTVNSEVIVKHLLKYKLSGKLLDVGCATGDFLVAAKKYYDAEGLELSEWSRKIAESRGIKIHQKLLADMDPLPVYDVVTLWGVIEHFEYPNKEMSNIARIIKPGGIVCLWTGDISSIIAFMMRKKWWYFQGQHIQMFTNKSMNLLFENGGFEKVKMSYFPYVFTYHSLLNSVSRYPAIHKIMSFLFPSQLFSGVRFTWRLPGEMFAIFRKKNVSRDPSRL
jgi:ubiquinone/menaquinone biosynthesis C-methylase UbiE